MKTFFTSTFILFAFTNSFSQSGILKTVGGIAKEKSKNEASDFNSSRSNRERGNISDDKNSSTSADSTSNVSKAAATTTDKVYTFELHITYDMQDLKKKKEDVMVMNSYYSQNAMMNVVDENNSTILDVKNNSMLMIDEKGKSVMAMSSSMMTRGMDKKVAEENDKYTIEKTGNKKEILGYSCEEYLSTNKETGEKTSMWVTNAISNEFAVNFGNQMMGNAKQTSNFPKSDMNGVMMEMTSYDKKGVAEFHMIMTKFERGTTVKDLSAYRFTKL